MPDARKVICKSVEVEMQTENPDSPRAFVAFDRAEMANAATIETQGALLK
jgi:hypothetical protein